MNVLNHRGVSLAGVAVAVALGAAACGQSYGTSHSAGATSNSSLIRSEAATVGGTTMTILTDANGLPLYYYGPDTATTSRVTGGLARVWPPLTAPKAPDASMLSGRVGLLHDGHGSQVTYNGHPLYTFVSDRSGVVTGQGVHGFYIATPSLPTDNGK